MKKQPVCPLLVLLGLCIVLLVASCGYKLDTADQPTPENVAVAAVVEPLGAAVLPVDVPMQLLYTPQRGGGSSSVTFCNEPERISEGTTLFTTTGGAVDDDTIKIGQNMVICYADLTPGPVEERIIGPDGATVRTTSFTIDELKVVQAQFIIGPSPEVTLAANDFTVLPNDAPGFYTVVAQTSDGEFMTSFEVIDAIVTAEDSIDLSSRPDVTPIGHGTNVESLDAAEYIFLSNFAVDETVDIFFYESCSNTDSSRLYVDFFDVNFIFIGGIQAQVNANGQAFVAIPSDIANSLQPYPISYIITALGSRSEPMSVWGALEDAGESPVDAQGAEWMTAFWAIKSMGRVAQHAEELPPCPART